MYLTDKRFMLKIVESETIDKEIPLYLFLVQWKDVVFGLFIL